MKAEIEKEVTERTVEEVYEEIRNNEFNQLVTSQQDQKAKNMLAEFEHINDPVEDAPMQAVGFGTWTPGERFNAVNGQDKPVRAGTELYLVKALFHECTVNDAETGEVRPAVRTVLIDEDGITYGSVSEGVCRSLQRLFKAVGTPDKWEKPLHIVFMQKTFTRKEGGMPRTTYDLKVLDE